MASNQYPSFEANQVLTNAHLNQLFDYVDDQNRLTRANLIGVGVVCGLEFQLGAGGNSLALSRGCGVGSAGYLLEVHDNLVLNSYKTYSLPDALEYASFYDGMALPKQFDLYELCPAGTPNTTLLSARPVNFLDDKILLLFLELKKENLRNCSPNNCDDKGAQVTATPKILLINKVQADLVIAKATHGTTEIINNYKAKLALKNYAFPAWRPVKNTVKSANQLIKSLQTVFTISDFPKNLVAELTAMEIAFAPLLKGLSYSVQVAKLNLMGADFTKKEKIPYLQNYYDFYNDLLLAYYECRDFGTDLICLCCPDENLFPRHLFLGALNPNAVAEPLLYRTAFYPSSAIGQCEAKVQQLMQLFKRIAFMIDAFNPQPSLYKFNTAPADLETRITPTAVGDIPLSRKAIPYYYPAIAGVHINGLWNPERTAHKRANTIQSYRHFEYFPLPPSFVTDPLKFDLENFNFLRIEGHLGKPVQGVMQALESFRSISGLPIEIIALETGDTKSIAPNFIYFDTLKNFLVNHSGVQHKAGVPLGGTFVVVCKGPSDNEPIVGSPAIDTHSIVADFYLPYPVTPPVQAGQKIVRECEFEWIDSVNHVHNILTRAYGLNKANPPKTLAAKEAERTRLSHLYVIRVYRYEIQHQDILKASFVDVEISLESLKANKLNAVAAALNEKFPNGLVFDYKEGTNKLLIRHLDGQDFRIELGGIQGNQLHYAYTNGKIYRLQKSVWEDMTVMANYQVVCKTLGGKYDENDYTWLHHNYAANTKSIAPLPTTKEIIAWDKMIAARTRLYKRQVPPFIQSIVMQLYYQIQNIDGNAQVMLIGAWANGSWVSHYSNQNTESLGESGAKKWNEFLRLRTLVTGKTGSSDIDLLVDSQYDIQPSMLHVPSLYNVNIIKGKKDAQKGIVIRGGKD